jgi:hypothetical protein
VNLDDLIAIDLKEPKIGSEDSAWATLRAKFAAAGCHIQRFEDKLSTGIPDSNICYRGREFWFEGKFLPKYPVRLATPVRLGLKPDQCNWLTLRSRAGARCYVWSREPRCWRLINSDFEKVRDGLPKHEWVKFGREFASSKELVECLLNEL